MSLSERRNKTLIRMLSLLRILHRTGARSVAQLASDLHVSRRSIYRDLNALEELHVPLVTKVNDWDGIRTVQYDRLGPCPVCAREYDEPV